MKRLFIIFVMILVAATLSAQLGLRTLTPEPTETIEATDLEAVPPAPEGLPALTLRTVDSLLVTFREGWKGPDDPAWKTETIGTSKIMIPDSYSIFQEKMDLNYDAQIFDEDNALFGRLFFYQLESYEREELVEAVVASLYGESASTDRAYEETVELESGLVAYLASLKVKPEAEYPFIAVYYPSEELDVTEPGPVTMFVFELANYQGSELKMAKEIISKIVGSFIDVEEELEEEVVVPELEKSEHTDLFVKMIDSLLKEDDIDINIDDWLEVEGDYFGFLMPPEFSVQFYLSDYFEVADLGLRGTIVGKLFVGETDEPASTEGVLNELVYEYLGGFGNFEVVDSYSGNIGRESTVNVFALDFSGQLCWIALFSESVDAEVFGPGEYFALVGLADSQDAENWAKWYTGILATLDF